MAKIKIVRIITRLNIGGPTKQAVLLNTELSKHGFESMLIAGSLAEHEGDMSYFAQECGIKPIIVRELGRKISFINDMISFYKIYKIIRKEKPQIVHTHMAKAGTVGRFAAKLAQVPVIVHTFHGHTFHSYFGFLKTSFFISIERLLAGLTDKIVVISKKQKEEIKKYLSLKSEEKLTLIPLGFDLDKFFLDKDESALRETLNIKSDAIVIGIVGRLTAIKNHEMFLLAAREIKMANPKREIKFLIIGDGELKNDMMRLSKRLDIYNDTIFLGWRKDVDCLYRVMDIVALTSFNEGTPVSVIEAQASAKPVVATLVGGVSDVVIDNMTGFLVPSQDVEAFVRAIGVLLNDDVKRKRFGESARNHVCSKYLKEKLVNSIKDLYHNELERKGKR